MSSAVIISANPNALSPRAAMGLPDSLVDRLGPDVLVRHAELLSLSASALIDILESNQALPRRYAAGCVLALLGDPRINVLQPQMIRLPGGKITLGLSVEDAARVTAEWAHVGVIEEWILKECPRYQLEIQPFAMARFPVTNAEFYQFLQETQAPFLPSSWQLGAYPAHLANHPVWTIAPEAADAYAAWLAKRTGRQFRLPTEAEWEYAASNGDEREFPWGAKFMPEYANTVEAGPLCTTPVGMYPAGRSASGIDDLAGNIEEYVADMYHAYPGGEHIADDLLVTQGDYRVARGGSFTRFGDLARCQRRHGWYHSVIYAMGFRLAETVS